MLSKRKLILVLAFVTLVSVIVVHHTLSKRTRSSSNVLKTSRFIIEQNNQLSGNNRNEVLQKQTLSNNNDVKSTQDEKADVNNQASEGGNNVDNQENATLSVSNNAKDEEEEANKNEESITIVNPSDDKKTEIVSEDADDASLKLTETIEKVFEEDVPNACKVTSPYLVGPLKVNQNIPIMVDVEKQIAESFGGWVEKGGKWRPTECVSRSRVAIIIPYRKRYEQLSIFVRHMHPMLKRQQLDYRIFVIEQHGETPFNRAMLFNIGYAEAVKLYDFNCFIFHDVDLIPEDDRNDYGCPTNPRHMSVAVDKFNYRLPYASIFGGVGAFNKQQFELINGFSNKFWGWGGEDDDLYQRITAKGLKLVRPAMNIGRYKMIRVFHKSAPADPERNQKLRNSKERMHSDGLNSLKYNRVSLEEKALYTLVTVDINKSMV